MLSRSRDTLTPNRLGDTACGLGLMAWRHKNPPCQISDRVTLAYPSHIRNPDFFAIAGRTRSQAGCPQWREGAGGKGGNLGKTPRVKIYHRTNAPCSGHEAAMLDLRGLGLMTMLYRGIS